MLDQVTKCSVTRRIHLPRLSVHLLVAALITAAAAGWHGYPASTAAGAEQGEGDRNSDPFKDLQWQGVSSCAAAACHHGNGPKGAKGSEYTTWILSDPHARAYRVLLEDRSRTIQKNRKLSGPAQVAPQDDALCLACHAMNPDRSHRSENFTKADGVGCESCHGPAQKWLSLHYLEDWHQKSESGKESYGMRPTKDVGLRAEACVGCHVGAPDREVNHDLIAAGHPRLNFEYAAYLANLPKHWQEQGDNAKPDFPARVWLAGQIASAQAALDLLQSRARGAALIEGDRGPTRPWPEFAEYDCFACHHNLRDDTNRQQRAFGKREPGSYAWGDWYFSLAPAVCGEWSQEDAAKLQVSLQSLGTLMGHPYPDPQQVAREAGDAREVLRGCARSAKKAAYQPRSVSGLLSSLSGHAGGAAPSSWDGSAQLYLGIVALHDSAQRLQPSPRDAEILDRLRQLHGTLQFKPGYESPADSSQDPFLADLKKLAGLLAR